ncbi:MAG: sulfatase, partial [bacterium]
METRRQFLSRGANALGLAALASLGGGAFAAPPPGARKALPNGKLTVPVGAAHLPDFVAKAKHVIYLHMVGGPPQMDLYDYKPRMQEFFDKDLPASVRNGQRLTTMTSGQSRFPIAPSK